MTIVTIIIIAISSIINTIIWIAIAVGGINYTKAGITKHQGTITISIAIIACILQSYTTTLIIHLLLK